MPDVFILGAGFSKAISPSMPLLQDLSHTIRERVSLGESVLSMGDNIEMWLTYLSQSHPWLSEAENLRNRAQYLDLSREVSQILEERMKQAQSETNPQWLTQLVELWHIGKASVVSLNYDTFVEQVAATIQIQRSGKSDSLKCQDIYPVPLTSAYARVGMVLSNPRWDSFQLFKLHGSTNWFYSGSTSFAFYGETIYFVPTLPKAEKADGKGVDYSEYTSDKVPLIVPPAIDKTPYFQHETIRNLWFQAGSALREARRIFCLGYSLPETDVSMRMFLLSNAPEKSVEFNIVNTDRGAQDHFTRLLGKGHYEIKALDLGNDPISSLTQLLGSGASAKNEAR